ncbi:hypothetical protein F5Y14DRAFT_446815 [Nemania sp. NC0429]|nr:hypothetical protein F5Y14DRAFT_446815 [Nemania sp. NC0429]
MRVMPRRANTRRARSIMCFPLQLRSFFAGLAVILPLLVSLAAPASSTPISYFPFNSQLPPVARVAEPFSFTFSPLTFSSDAEMSYALADGAPAWLSLDSASREISGTPDDALIPSGDTLVGVPIALVATDGTGSTAANATLVVSRGPAPVVRIPLEDQIDRFGPNSPPASILLHPSIEFAFEFDPGTFGLGIAGGGNGPSNTPDVKVGKDSDRTERPDLNYYAVSGDNAPLPSWIRFNEGKLGFSGKTPSSDSLVQPPQKFGFRLVASDVVGFSSAFVDFSIVVGRHELTVDEPTIQLNMTRGKPLEYTELPGVFKLDNRPLATEDVSSIAAVGLPAWLAFDKISWKVSGTPGKDAQPTNVTIVVADKFSDTVNVTLALDFHHQHTNIFISDLPGLDLPVGDDFSFDLKKFLVAPAETQVTAAIQPDDAWIRFDDSSQLVFGTVPRPQTAGFANETQIKLIGTRNRTQDREEKTLNIHVNIPPERPPKPKTKKGDDSDSHSYLFWLLPILGLLVATALVAVFFVVRRRRQQPRKLDFSEVSGPVPGTFVANGFMDNSLDDIQNALGTGKPAPRIRSNRLTLVIPSHPRLSQTMANQGGHTDQAALHARNIHSGLAQYGKAVSDTRRSWFSGRQGRPSPVTTDEVSLLSDTSLGEEVHMSEEDLSPTKLPKNMFEKKVRSEAPKAAEPFSIQPTPELAYAVARKYDYVSDDEMPHAVGHTERRRSSYYKQSTGSGLGGIQHRLSKAWKRASASKLGGNERRHSQISSASSSDATTRTSILTSGVTEEATTASTNMVAKPTVIHIPSRLGEARQVSRRTDDSSTFFGGRSLTKSQRNFGLSKDAMPVAADPPVPRAQDVPSDGETTWNWMARNSLGIAYRDVVPAALATGLSLTSPEKRKIGLAQSDNWDTGHTSRDLASPGQWPVPDGFLGHGDKDDVFRGQSEPPERPALPKLLKTEPSEPRGAMGRMRESLTHISLGSGFIPSLSKTPLARKLSKARSSREERLRISRIREKKALDEFRAMMSSQMPSPDDEWAVGGTRQLPETPSRVSRAQLADGPNDPRGLKSALSKQSVKTFRSNKSVRSAWTNDGDDDEWEDVRPPESVVGGWQGEGSDGSFPVYI